MNTIVEMLGRCALSMPEEAVHEKRNQDRCAYCHGKMIISPN